MILIRMDSHIILFSASYCAGTAISLIDCIINIITQKSKYFKNLILIVDYVHKVGMNYILFR